MRIHPAIYPTAIIIALTQTSFAQVTLPFDIAPYQHVDAAVKKFRDKAIDATITRSEEGSQEVRATNIEWKDVAYDTVKVSFTGQPEEATMISLIRVCDEDDVDKATEQLIADLSELYGAPTEDAVEYAIWSRGLRQAIFLGRREDNQSVAASIDVESMVYRRSSTDPDWPYEIPIDAPRDEIERIVLKECGRLFEKDDMYLSTVGCSWLGITSRRMIVWNDEAGLITKIEARFDPTRESEVRDAIVKKYGKQTMSVENGTAWRWAGSDDAIRLETEDHDLIITIDVLAMERRQYTN